MGPDAWHAAVWQMVQEVPHGRVSRHVGKALRSLRPGDFGGRGPVPWWRIVNSSGGVSFREGDIVSTGSTSEQQNLLIGEGVTFSPAARAGSRIRSFVDLRWSHSSSL